MKGCQSTASRPSLAGSTFFVAAQKARMCFCGQRGCESAGVRGISRVWMLIVVASRRPPDAIESCLWLQPMRSRKARSGFGGGVIRSGSSIDER